MSVTERFYGANTMGTGRPIQDFGLSDTKGVYNYTAKLRVKGLLVVVFYAPDSAPSVEALRLVQSWTEALPTQKWTALGVGEGDRTEMAQFAEVNGLANVSLLLDFELYQTRMWGVSHLPSVYLVSGKTGRVLQKVMGMEGEALAAMQGLLTEEVGKIVAAEAAAKKADEEKKAADAAAAAAKAVEAAAKPSDTTVPTRA